jgi:hypothetical protein
MLKLSGATQTLLTEGMGGRLKTRNGQLVPLKHRMNKHQMAKRKVRIAARNTIAEQLIQMQQQFMVNVARELFRRTLKGKLFFAKQRMQRFFSRKQAAA